MQIGEGSRNVTTNNGKSEKEKKKGTTVFTQLEEKYLRY